MKKTSQNFKSWSSKCQMHLWPRIPDTKWLTHQEKLCNSCAFIFHNSWELEITKHLDFIKTATKAIMCIIKKLESNGKDFNRNCHFIRSDVFISEWKQKCHNIIIKYNDKKINKTNKDIFVNDWRSLLKDIFESQEYCIFI